MGKFFPVPTLYNAPYNFRRDLNGAVPTDWIAVGGNGSIVAEIGDHKKVFDIIQDGNVVIYSFADQATGKCEFWLRVADCIPATVITIEDFNWTQSLNFGIAYPGAGPDNWFIYVSATAPGGARVPGSPVPVDNQWYHILIDWDCAANWTVEIDGISYGPMDYNGAPVAMDGICIWDYTMGASQHSYWDAFDFSWSSGYFTNRNQTVFNNKINKYMSKPILRALEDVV